MLTQLIVTTEIFKTNKNPIENIFQLRKNNPSNPLIGYLNINNLRNKIIDIREIFTKIFPDYFVFAETKLGETFPNSQFLIENFEIIKRKDRNKNGGG